MERKVERKVLQRDGLVLHRNSGKRLFSAPSLARSHARPLAKGWVVASNALANVGCAQLQLLCHLLSFEAWECGLQIGSDTE